jgi:hypothetical protein
MGLLGGAPVLFVMAGAALLAWDVVCEVVSV